MFGAECLSNGVKTPQTDEVRIAALLAPGTPAVHAGLLTTLGAFCRRASIPAIPAALPMILARQLMPFPQ
jgi:hypothetical protein